MEAPVSSESSDSDSDYFPESVVKSLAREKSDGSTIKEAMPKAISNPSAPFTMTHLPSEVLVMIFRHVVQQVSPFVALKKYGLVCKQWRSALLENVLWHSVSLDARKTWLNIDQALKWLCKYKLLAIKKLTVSSWRRGHSQTSFEQLLQICSHVKCVEFFDCVLKFEVVFSHLNQVEKLVIRKCAIKSFNVLLQNCKEKLRCLSLHEVSNDFCNSLMKCDMPLLRLNTLKLDQFCCVKAASVLQKMCPNLEYLQLYAINVKDSCRVIHSDVSPNGFVVLLHLELYFKIFNSGRDETETLFSMLAASPNLQCLHLIHYTQAYLLDFDKLVSLFPQSLTELGLYSCLIDNKQLLSKLFYQCSSLQCLTISNPNTWKVTDDVISTIINSTSISTLNYLDLSGTDVSMGGIRSLLNSASNLKHLNLLRCRYLPRGTKRIYTGPADLQLLSKKILL